MRFWDSVKVVDCTEAVVVFAKVLVGLGYNPNPYNIFLTELIGPSHSQRFNNLNINVEVEVPICHHLITATNKFKPHSRTMDRSVVEKHAGLLKVRQVFN